MQLDENALYHASQEVEAYLQGGSVHAPTVVEIAVAAYLRSAPQPRAEVEWRDAYARVLNAMTRVCINAPERSTLSRLLYSQRCDLASAALAAMIVAVTERNPDAA